MSDQDPEDHALEELTTAQCWELVATQQVGRLAAPVTGDGPLVLPVNFAIDSEAIVFRSDYGSKLFVARDQPVSFQVDEFDAAHRSGWSVLLRGFAREVAPSDVEHLSLASWPAGERAHWIKIEPTAVTGRRIRLGASPDPRGYL
jgi:nitroimidazol reductase NimA-like FMN-containing flavoprotein (pyridoxamine 5'-phosphate oxidase superfamily)